MGTVTLSPRALPTGATRAALYARNYRPSVLLAVFGVGAFFAAFVALAAREQPGFSLMMVSLALLLGALGPIVVRWTSSVTEGRVRVAASGPGLRFLPRRSDTGLFTLMAVFGLLPAVVVLGFAAYGIPAQIGGGILRWSPYGLALLSLAWLAQQLWSLRIPAGLTVTEQGLAGVRGTARADLVWAGLTDVRAVFARGAKLVFTRLDGRTIIVEPRWTGSDPNEVAAIIEHFRLHPADRALLADPRSAIRRVEEVAAGR